IVVVNNYSCISEESRGRVDYRLVGTWSRFQVDTEGRVRTRLPLDRESPEGSSFIVNVIAIDRGFPPLTSTGTLSISLSDVNDCPPRLLPPFVLHVKENIPRKII
ncbi:Cadherin-related tumor suppressor, partial [Armadillidium vulgare]